MQTTNNINLLVYIYIVSELKYYVWSTNVRSFDYVNINKSNEWLYVSCKVE